ncbi:MAG: TonB-dependent receptor [Candidatus Marinimicrobia bacterium]|nr:TonB-dependent receptor [Candidatus Neomarinimicrobiota bacterium]MCF7904861.1 TonB-dependent receptor [Candidatus Neomarinimicrobiota bacterium]
MKPRSIKYIFFLVSFLFVLEAYSQTQSGRVNGFLRDAQTGEPLLYANVSLKNTGMGAASDNMGYYIIQSIPPGKYTLQVLMIGYERAELEISVVAGLEERYDFEIEPSSVQGEEVIVTGDRQRFEKEIEVSAVSLSMRDVKTMPAFVEADIFRSIQLLPGVQSSSDFSSALVVRGGSPDENLIMLDGIEIYNPFHLGGVFSTFNADAIADAEFLAGGFPAEYGNRISSVLSITGREGDSKHNKLFIDHQLGDFFDVSQVRGEVNLLSSKLLIEGPIGKGSWMFSGRRTYFDQIARVYYWYKDEPMDWNYYFYDFQGKVIQNINPTNRLSFSHYKGRDRIAFELEQSDSKVDFIWDWGNSTKSLEWRWVPNSKFVSTLSAANTTYKFDVDLSYASLDSNGTSAEGQFIVYNEIDDWTIKENLDWYLSSKHTVTMGLELKDLGVKFNIGDGDISFIDENEQNMIYSGIIQERWQPNPVIMLQTGLRISKYSAHENLYYEPRVGFKYLLNENLAIKGAWGKYNQFIFTAQDEDAILSIVDFWNPIPKNYRAKSVEHYILGVEQWIGDGWFASVEAYYKPYSNTLVINPNQDFIDPTDDYTEGTAEVTGTEVLLKKNSGKLTGWVGFSYTNSSQEFDFNLDGQIREDEGEIYRSKYDQPFSVNVVMNYALSKKNTFGLTLSSSSSNLYTPTVAYIYTQNGSTFDFNNPYSDLTEFKGDRNSARYPNYFRMDVSYSREIRPFNIEGLFKVQIINVTNHFNTFVYNWDLSAGIVEGVGMFPFLPTFGLEFKF